MTSVSTGGAFGHGLAGTGRQLGFADADRRIGFMDPANEMGRCGDARERLLTRARRAVLGG